MLCIWKLRCTNGISVGSIADETEATAATSVTVLDDDLLINCVRNV